MNVTSRRVPSLRKYDWAKVKFRHTYLHKNKGPTPCYTPPPKIFEQEKNSL